MCVCWSASFSLEWGCGSNVAFLKVLDLVASGQEPRQTTSNIGHLQRPTITALVHGLNRNYYSITINCRKGDLENQMLMNLHKNKWNDALKLQVHRTLLLMAARQKKTEETIHLHCEPRASTGLVLLGSFYVW